MVEAKRASRSVDAGVAQAKRYATLLDLPIAYATNGRRIVEINLRAGTEHDVARFRTPDEIWDLYRDVELSTEGSHPLFAVPYSRVIVDSRQRPKLLRYYQDVALRRILAAIARAQRRVLTVLATGTGKSYLAAQLVHVLWSANWPRGAESTAPRPRVLYLADRDVLITDPIDEYFRRMFGDAVRRIEGRADYARQIVFALYQTLDVAQANGQKLYEEYDSDWFDLVIVDECHRGSADEDSVWRGILEHFSGAVQLGLTATPRHDADVQTAEYFGEPVYEYSLRQGIEDGFLAPFEVYRVMLDSYVDGVYVPEGTRDVDDSHAVPAGHAPPAALDRNMFVEENTALAAQYLTAFLRQRDRMGKTIVFCRNQEHAARFAREMGNQNADLQRQYGNNWSVRITSDDGDPGKVLLGDFQDEDRPVPVVVATSDLLTTGVDVPTAKHIVFLTAVKSRSRFKQMVGRGTRLDLERDKEFFTIVDFRGVTQMFADPRVRWAGDSRDRRPRSRESRGNRRACGRAGARIGRRAGRGRARRLRSRNRRTGSDAGPHQEAVTVRGRPAHGRAASRGGVRAVHADPVQPAVLRQDRADEADVVLRDRAAGGSQAVLEDAPDAVRGIRRLPGVVGRSIPRGTGRERARVGR